MEVRQKGGCLIAKEAWHHILLDLVQDLRCAKRVSSDTRWQECTLGVVQHVVRGANLSLVDADHDPKSKEGKEDNRL